MVDNLTQNNFINPQTSPIDSSSPPIPSLGSTGDKTSNNNTHIPSAQRQKLVNLSLGLAIMVGALVGGAYLMINNSSALLGSKAAAGKQSTFLFTSPRSVKPGENFTVDIVLDTTGDPDYTITSADAQVGYRFTPQYSQGAVEVRETQIREVPLPTMPPNSTPVPTPTSTSIPRTTPIPSPSTPPMYIPIAMVGITNGKIFDSYTSSSINPTPTTNPSPKPTPYPSSTPRSDSTPLPTTTSYPGPTSSPYQTPYPTSYSTPYPSSSTIPGGGGYPPTVYAGSLKVSGVSKIKGNTPGFQGKDVFARVTFVTSVPGKLELFYVFTGPTSTDDSNIFGYLKKLQPSIQKPVERLLSQPLGLVVKAAYSENPLSSISPSSTPFPRPGAISCKGDIDCPKGYKCYTKPTPSCRPGSLCPPAQSGGYCDVFNPINPPTTISQ